MSECRYHHDQTGEQIKKDQGVSSLLLGDALQRRARSQTAALVVVITISREMAVPPYGPGHC